MAAAALPPVLRLPRPSGCCRGNQSRIGAKPTGLLGFKGDRRETQAWYWNRRAPPVCVWGGGGDIFLVGAPEMCFTALHAQHNDRPVGFCVLAPRVFNNGNEMCYCVIL